MVNWQTNHGINFRGGGSPEIKCNATMKGGNGLQIVMGGDIPDGAIGAKEAAELAMEVVNLRKLNGLPADKVESHIACLDATIEFCTKLKAALQD